MIILRRSSYDRKGGLAEQLGYSDNEILVIVNIDDIGLHKDETKASFDVFSKGMVKSGSIMVPCTNSRNAIEYWKMNPGVELGVHLTLTCEWGNKLPWAPVLSKAEVPGLYNPDGIMWASIDEVFQHANRKEIVLEIEAQINQLKSLGVEPTHMDYHMDFHQREDVFSDLLEISRKYCLPTRVSKRRRYKLPMIRNNYAAIRRRGYVFPDTQMGIYGMMGQCDSMDLRKAKYHDYLKSLKPGVHNIKIHVAFQTEELQYIMGEHDSVIRKIDYDVWSSDETRKLANDKRITFIGYGMLQRLQDEYMKSRL